MAQITPAVRITHSSAQERYEAFVGDDMVGYLDYLGQPDRVVLTHTVVLDRFTHQGYASELVRYVLDDIALRGLSVVPVCSYVQAFIDDHPPYRSMVAHA